MDEIKTISCDWETYSEADLSKCGVYRYAEDPSFEMLLAGISVNEQPPVTYDLACGEKIPYEILEAIVSKTAVVYSFNAAFERVCLSVYLRRNYPELFKSYSGPDDSVGGYLDPSNWRCDMVLAAYNGLPLSLASVGAVLGFEKQKLSEGKDLVKYFSIPCKPTQANGGRARNRPADAPDKWMLFKKYNVRDVEVQLQIHERLAKYPVPDRVWAEWFIDQKINDRGIRIDRKLATEAIRIDGLVKDDLTAKMKELTGLDNPNSVVQLKGWLAQNGIVTDALGKKDVKELLKTASGPAKEVLGMRQQLAKSSVKKYTAMLTSADPHDDRCRGLFQFYGANRTGRFSGRLVQLQNLPQNHMPDLDAARMLVRDGDYDTLALLYDNIPQVLSELIRTAFIPRETIGGKPAKLIVSDMSSIEARVLAYLAGEQWKMDAFARGEDIYCSTASRMFHKPVVKNGVNGELRAKGKIAELACGYGGSTGALKAMGALEMGLAEDELPGIVSNWRSANEAIVSYWWDIDMAVKKAIRYHMRQKVGSTEFFWKSGVLFIRLPSGRTLSYIKPRIGTNRFGGESVTYMGLDQQKHWSRLESYGPKFCENIVQGFARDVLCFAMRNLKDLNIVGHVHDELIIECPEDMKVNEISDVMGITPPWAPGLLLRAEGYECPYYQKS